MSRIAGVTAAAMIGLLVCAPTLLAQSGGNAAYPLYPFDPADPHAIDRGPGGYFSIIKLILVWLLFLVWVRTVDWLNRDCYKQDLNYGFWMPLLVFPFLGTLLLVTFNFPFFVVGYLLLIVAYAGPVAYYTVERNKEAKPGDEIFTERWFRETLAYYSSGFGVKVETKPKAPHEEGPPVHLTPMGAATPQDDQANGIRARQTEAYLIVKNWLGDALLRRAQRVVLDYSQQSVHVKYEIDGVLYEHGSRDRPTGDAALSVIKTLAAMNADERRQRQEGRIGVEYQGNKQTLKIVSKGTQTGEQVVLRFEGENQKFDTLADLGMQPAMTERVKELMARPSGLLLITGLPQGGLTTTLRQALRSTDRYMRDFVELEPKGSREPEVENVERVEYDTAKGHTPAKALPSVLLKEPDVLIIRDMSDKESVHALCEAVTTGKLGIGTLRSKDAAEAILRLLQTGVDRKLCAKALTAVLHVRLIRKLCDQCKVAYQPSPEALQKLGLPAKVQTLYQEKTPPAKPPEDYQPCPQCGDLGYYGRMALFELLIVDDNIRKAIVQQPKLETIRALAQKAGHQSLQQEGLLLMVQGHTSWNELVRVRKQ